MLFGRTSNTVLEKKCVRERSYKNLEGKEEVKDNTLNKDKVKVER
jgi:hypothetical protein